MSAAVKCENCGFYGDLDQNYFYGPAVPKGWVDLRYIVGSGRGHQGDDPGKGGTFCRFECAAAHLAKVAAERNVVDASTAYEGDNS